MEAKTIHRLLEWGPPRPEAVQDKEQSPEQSPAEAGRREASAGDADAEASDGEFLELSGAFARNQQNPLDVSKFYWLYIQKVS